MAAAMPATLPRSCRPSAPSASLAATARASRQCSPPIIGSILDREIEREVVPAKHLLHGGEAGGVQQIDVLAILIGHEHVLERLALLGDLAIGVALRPFVTVIE